jgi:hypothetical protein
LNANRLLVTAGIVGVGGVATVVVYFLTTQGTVAYAMRRPVDSNARPGSPLTDRDIELWITRDGKEVRFADNQTGMPPAREWTHRPYRFAIPPNAREVPVTNPVRTPLVPGGFNRNTGERVRYLNAVRDILRRAGLGAYDPRILMILYANESAWDRASWGYNLGNVKAQNTVYARSYPELLRTRKVFVTVPESSGVQVFKDNLRSIDGYHTFADPADYMRYSNRVAIVSPNYANRQVTVGGRVFRGAPEALTVGGIAGCEAFARIVSLGGYSPEGPDQRARMFVGAWNRSAQLCGAGWVR